MRCGGGGAGVFHAVSLALWFSVSCPVPLLSVSSEFPGVILIVAV